jgi:hypothetical protein
MTLELRRWVVAGTALGTCQELVFRQNALELPTGEIGEVSVEGSTATARVRASKRGGRPRTLELVRRGDVWMIADFPFPPSTSGRTATLWAVGDGDGGVASAALAQRIERSRFDRFLYLGDVYQRGTPEDFAKNYATTYGRISRRTAPTLGDHELDERSSGYDAYWQGVHGERPPSFYSFDAGGWQILSLDSNAGASHSQLKWLKRQIQRRGTCRLAYWHHPRYTATAGRSRKAAPLWSMVRGHASVVVSGHHHNMQRFAQRHGITQFVSGAGGHGHHRLDPSYPRLAFGNDDRYGALRLRLRPGSASYAFVDADGRTLDTGRIPCDTR